MEKSNIRRIAPKPQRLKRVRVAAYARVSTDHERQLSSIAAQVSYYSHLIHSTPGWEYAGVFIDEGITGTSTKHRDGLNDLMGSARAGGIDMVLCKSISRLARNTVDLLEIVRELRTLGVTIRFERENIDTATADGELLLTLLASFAQEESRSISKNVKWGIRKKYATGGLHSRQPYGYKYEKGDLVIVDAEARVVKRVFDQFLAGLSPEAIARQLNADGITPRRGRAFHGQVLRKILENQTYTGTVMLQQYYRHEIANAAVSANTGELPCYLVTSSHPPIISPDQFQAVRDELTRRRQLGRGAAPSARTCGLTSRIECSACGRFYHRRTKTRGDKSYKFWWCETATKGKGNPCHAPQIRHTLITSICADTLGWGRWDDEQALHQLKRMIAHPDGTLTIHTTTSNTPVVVNIHEKRPS